MKPTRIATASRALPVPVSEGAVRHHFRGSPKEPFDLTLLRDALIEDLPRALLAQYARRAAVPSLGAALIGDLEHAWEVRRDRPGIGRETLVILLATVADTDPVARGELSKLDSWFRGELEKEYRAALPDSGATTWCRELADVRYVELLYWRLRGSNAAHAREHRDVVRWLAGQYVPEAARPRPRRTERDRFPSRDDSPRRADSARTRAAILDAAFAVLAAATPEEFLGFLTPSTLAPLVRPPVDRTTVAAHYSAAGSDAFSTDKLIDDLWPSTKVGELAALSTAEVLELPLQPGASIIAAGATDSEAVDRGCGWRSFRPP